jgi:hypothetical protein
VTRSMFRTTRSLALIVLVLAVFSGVSASNEPSVASAQVSAGSTYYVSPGGSDMAAGTEGEPFRTIQRAASLVEAGDTVVVRAGRYEGFSWAGTLPRAGPRTGRSH